MTDAKSAVRAALLELIEADGKATTAPIIATRTTDGKYHLSDSKAAMADVKNSEDALFLALARNLAPGMAKIILKMLDDPDCLMCGGIGYKGWSASSKTAMQDIPCPRCAARWQEWAGLLGVV